ncbi:M1 family metallopeptidase [Algoriphagus sp.]|jgi:aminopeptidase N|uniref:M1 family metallopeptidase n=1 Tax=Algoriphagus sp. TaxID=1872435 RepID=UPI002726B6CA|nr:M1 family metallopeptidase [Algoriphagus sp.]MDO8965776.1 M1 family metallopeptidase [Algoriphagus sp.]MDP3198871.1 M1 family metallopeptidase [Algoriphagus sp.]
MKFLQTIYLLLFLSVTIAKAQQKFTRADTLRGSITPERAWWDLNHYHLAVEIFPESKSIKGSNTIRYRVLSEQQVLQIDLQEPLKIASILQEGEKLDFKREGAVHWVRLKKKQVPGSFEELIVNYEGQPKEAIRPPWDGGITWQKDSNGKHFIASSNQGIGSSIWWPLKDHPADEVDSLMISVTVPEGLMDVSNGRLVGIDLGKGKNTYHWSVVNPINDYGVNINIGDYVHFGEKYAGEKGTLDMDYFVLRENLEKAKVHFQDARRMMEAFEHWFGPYPFYEDGFKLVDAPYLGMEHQSSVTYGNGYQMGYRGRDLSGTGWGLKFDFIIIHEAGHEWFANNITYKDVADMWIHESFTNYSESLFLDFHYGKEAGQEYVRGTRMNIANDRPIIGTYGLNQRGSGDMYYKGGNLLNMLREILNDDEKWRQILRGLNQEFYHQTVTTLQVESFISQAFGMDLKPVFDQYLRDARVPILEYYYSDNQTLSYRWISCLPNFTMPVDVEIGGKKLRILSKTAWSELKVQHQGEVKVDPDYYVGLIRMR